MNANKAMQATLSEPMVAGLVALRKNKLSESDLTDYETGLKAKSFTAIQTAFENEKSCPSTICGPVAFVTSDS